MNNMCRILRVVLVQVTLLLGACASVRYTPYSRIAFPPTARAVIIEDTIPELESLFSAQKLPHLTIREQMVRRNQILDLIMRKVGSQDYLLLGAIQAGGSDGDSDNSTRNDIAERAADVGGDVVVVVESGVTTWEETRVVPGTSHTDTKVSAQGSAQSFGDYVSAKGTGSGESKTVYTPAYTHISTHSSAFAQGFVLRHQPGVSADRARVLELPDAELEEYVLAVRGLANAEPIDFATYEAERCKLLAALANHAANSSPGEMPSTIPHPDS